MIANANITEGRNFYILLMERQQGQKCFAVGTLFVVVYLSVAMVSLRRLAISGQIDMHHRNDGHRRTAIWFATAMVSRRRTTSCGNADMSWLPRFHLHAEKWLPRSDVRQWETLEHSTKNF